MDLLSMNKKAHPRPIKITFVLSEPGRARAHTKEEKGLATEMGLSRARAWMKKEHEKRGKVGVKFRLLWLSTPFSVLQNTTQCVHQTRIHMGT